MLVLVQVLTVMVASAAMGLALAHALEYPGKLRLSREEYHAVQRIYYPGFTIGGVAEPLGILLTVVLLLLTPRGTPAFWLVVAALLALAGMQAVYWVFTHPVNRYWLGPEKLGSVAAGFFSTGSRRRGEPGGSGPMAWEDLRDRWEGSHVARAVLGGVGLLALVVASTCGR